MIKKKEKELSIIIMEIENLVIIQMISRLENMLDLMIMEILK